MASYKFQKKKLKDIRFFKKRNRSKIGTLNLKFGDVGIFSETQIRFFKSYFLKIKKYLKYFVKKRRKKKTHKKKRTWFFLKRNYIITKKPKNSRMGKGKGPNVNAAIFLKNNYFFIEHLGARYNRVKLVYLKLNKKINTKFKVFKKNLPNIIYFFKNFTNIKYYKKYKQYW